MSLLASCVDILKKIYVGVPVKNFSEGSEPGNVFTL